MAPIFNVVYTVYGFVQRNSSVSVSCGLYMWSDLGRYTALEVRAALAISYRLYSYIQSLNTSIVIHNHLKLQPIYTVRLADNVLEIFFDSAGAISGTRALCSWCP